jgi:hypothetical protein
MSTEEVLSHFTCWPFHPDGNQHPLKRKHRLCSTSLQASRQPWPFPLDANRAAQLLRLWIRSELYIGELARVLRRDPATPTRMEAGANGLPKTTFHFCQKRNRLRWAESTNGPSDSILAIQQQQSCVSSLLFNNAIFTPKASATLNPTAPAHAAGRALKNLGIPPR